MIKKFLDTLRSRCKCFCFIQCCMTVPEDQFDHFTDRATEVQSSTNSTKSAPPSVSSKQNTPGITDASTTEDYFSFIPNQQHGEQADVTTPLLQRQRTLGYSSHSHRGSHTNQHQSHPSHNP